MDFIIILIIAFFIGTTLGFIFQKSQFCMTLILTESFLFNNHRRMVGLIAAILFSTILFNIAVFSGLIENYNLLQNVGVNPAFFKAPLILERHIMGGLIFGFGMILAGGCVAGILFRIGEGQLSSLIGFIGLMSGFAGAFLLEKLYLLEGIIVIYPSGLLLPTILGVRPIIFTIIAILFFLLIILALHYKFNVLAIRK
ncbi:YeeE/YedE thiosulfate transporter family protein [[Eubacterium] cellulosolvens]